jgi:hypothetical protein
MNRNYSYAVRTDTPTPESTLMMLKEAAVLDKDGFGIKSLIELANNVDRETWTIADIPLLQMVRTDKLTKDSIKNLPDTPLKQYLMPKTNGGKSRRKKSRRRRSKRRRS